MRPGHAPSRTSSLFRAGPRERVAGVEATGGSTRAAAASRGRRRRRRRRRPAPAPRRPGARRSSAPATRVPPCAAGGAGRGHALAVELEAVAEPLQLDGHRAGAGAARARSGGSPPRRARAAPSASVAEGGVGLDQLGQRDAALRASRARASPPRRGPGGRACPARPATRPGRPRRRRAVGGRAHALGVERGGRQHPRHRGAARRSTWSTASKSGSLSSWRSRL